MKTQIELDVKLWAAPNFVLVRGLSTASGADGDVDFSMPLAAVDANTLERLCDEYRDEVFKKAGKSRPPQNRPASRCIECGKHV